MYKLTKITCVSNKTIENNALGIYTFSTLKSHYPDKDIGITIRPSQTEKRQSEMLINLSTFGF